MTTLLHKAYLLHQRSFRETSVIVDLLTETEGRVSAVCKGVRGGGKKASSMRSILQPFSELSVQWTGKTELKSLRLVETVATAPRLSQYRLYAALYLNELLVRLFQPGESHMGLFENYSHAVNDLSLSNEAEQGSTEIPLRRFELKLLSVLGFGIDFSFEANTGEDINGSRHYLFESDVGFTEVDPVDKKIGRSGIKGDILLALHRQDLSDPLVRKIAKKIIREALAPHLGGRPLKSRELYASPR